MARVLNYDLRPEKQVERKIILEILNELRWLNYKISSYRYIGMPSIFYYDFILFYKYLYIEDMIWFESQNMPKRIEFNRPYDFVKIKLWNFRTTFKKTHFSKRTILWLDYTTALDREKLETISEVTSGYLKAWSIMIITTTSSYPIDSEESLTKFNNKIEWFWDYLILEGDVNNISKINWNNLSSIYYKSIKACIDQALSTYNPDLQSIPLFHLQYADWVRMCSFWFMVERKSKAQKVISFLKKKKPELCGDTATTYEISLPVLTNKERKYLDQMQSILKKEIRDWRQASDLCNHIEIREQEVTNYLKHNKYHPNYFEWII